MLLLTPREILGSEIRGTPDAAGWGPYGRTARMGSGDWPGVEPDTQRVQFVIELLNYAVRTLEN